MRSTSAGVRDPSGPGLRRSRYDQPVSQLSDEQLYAKWSLSDERAGEQLMQRRMPGIRRVVQSLLVGDEVEDAVQEVFARLTRCAREGREIRHIKSFTAAIARNVVLEKLRARQRQPFNPYEHSLADIGPDQSARILHTETNRLLLKALHRMPVDDQFLLALRYWEMLRTKQLAAILGLNHNTLRTRLSRAEERLRQLITQLADSPEALESTLGSFTEWAQRHQEESERMGAKRP